MRNATRDGSAISGVQYSVDDVGNPTGMVLANGDRVTWTYDSLYRLTREQRSGANAYDVTYTFDGAGNRVAKVAGGVTTTYTYGAADALLVEDAAGARTTYSYDNAGNTTVAESAAGRTTYSWDGENRMTGIALPDGTMWTLSYDATGLRREKQTPVGTTRFIWDGQRLLQETDSGGTTQAHYTAGLGAYGPMLSQRRSGVSAFLHIDRLGTVRLLSDASAAPVDTYLFDAFGSLIASTGSTVNPHRYVGALGYYSEPALALDYVRARWLRPSTGSWLSVDPVPGEPRYGYVRGGPTWAVDPDGGQMGGAAYSVDTGPVWARMASTAGGFLRELPGAFRDIYWDEPASQWEPGESIFLPDRDEFAGCMHRCTGTWGTFITAWCFVGSAIGYEVPIFPMPLSPVIDWVLGLKPPPGYRVPKNLYFPNPYWRVEDIVHPRPPYQLNPITKVSSVLWYACGAWTAASWSGCAAACSGNTHAY